MVFRGVIAASCVVLALAAPAQAQSGCTTQLIADLSGDDETAPPYPIVERNPQTGSVTVHPQNVVPFTQYAAGRVVGSVDAIRGAVTAWVDCVV